MKPKLKLKKIHIATSSVALFALVIGGLFVAGHQQKPVVATEPVPVAPTIIFHSMLDGLPVEKEGEMHPRVLGVMIDNHPDARPQAGIAAARIVYEVPVEGGLTRYFALYGANQNVAKVGPVRSARPYFLDWLAEYGEASYWHCGGSPDALDLIETYDVWDVNQYYHDNYFWRSTDRDAPHNLYTSSNNWSTMLGRHLTDRINTSWQGFAYVTSTATSTGQQIKAVTIRYGTSYAVRWQYDSASQLWQRYHNGYLVHDADGSVVEASTVTIEEKRVEVLDEVGRRGITTVGSGPASVLTLGTMEKGVWKKESRTARTHYYDTDGKELLLQPGKMWIEVVPQDTEIIIES